MKSGWRLPHRGWSFSSPATTVRDNIAWVIGIEKIHTVLTNGNAVERSVLATSVFEKRNGQWLMVHHHGSRTPQYLKAGTRTLDAGHSLKLAVAIGGTAEIGRPEWPRPKRRG